MASSQYMVAGKVLKSSEIGHEEVNPPISEVLDEIPKCPTTTDKAKGPLLPPCGESASTSSLEPQVLIPLSSFMVPTGKFDAPGRLGKPTAALLHQGMPYDKRTRKTSRSPPSPSASLVRDRKSQLLRTTQLIPLICCHLLAHRLNTVKLRSKKSH